jgi:cell division protein FtsB
VPRRRFPTKLVIWGVLLLAAAVFAVQGGEYGTTDLFSQRARRATLAAVVDSLRLEVDSLRGYRDAIARDPVVQERIAREEFGMIRTGELLYRFAEQGDSLPAPSDSVGGGEGEDEGPEGGSATAPSP